VSSDQVHEEHDKKDRKRRRGIRMTLAVLAVVAFLIIAVPAICYLLFTMRAAERAEAELAKIRAAGFPVTAEELEAYHEYPPEGENVAKIWLDALKPFEYGGKVYEDDVMLPLISYTEKDKPIPPPGQPWEELEAVEKFLAKNAESIEPLHGAAENGRTGRYPVDLAKGWSANVSSIHLLAEGRRVLALQAHAKAHRDDARGTAKSIHALFMLGKSAEREPLFIAQLERMEIQNAARELTRRTLPYVEFSEQDLALLRADVQGIDNDIAFERGIVGDRAVSARVFVDPKAMADFTQESISTVAPRHDDLLLYLRIMDDFLAASKLPWPQRIDRAMAVDNEINALFATESRITELRYGLTSLLLPAVASITVRFARNEASTRGADTALAIEQFSRENGRLPEQLEELVPEFIEKAPLDPFDGRPLRYVVRKDEYVIYSIGSNRIDDGGSIHEGEDEYGNIVGDADLLFRVKRLDK